MAKALKNKPLNKPINNKPPEQLQDKKTQPLVANADQPNYLIYLMLVVLVTGLVFAYAAFCGFVNFDDELYIKYNLLLRSLSADNLSDIFFSAKGIYGGNYHPLVALTNAIEYNLVGYNAWLFHVDNVIIHLFNTILVYVFILRLSDKKFYVALLVALMFGIHPMHVESVVWVSERKDVLYSMFYLLSMIQYQKCLDQDKRINYLLSLLFFLCALMSKSMAVTLPVVLGIITWYKNGTVDRRAYVRIAPFLVLSLIFGGLAIYSQGLQKYVAAYNYSIIEKVFLMSYEWTYYLLHLPAPVKLSIMHSFPAHGLGIEYYLSILVPIAVLVAIIKFTQWRRLLLFGFMFYTASLAVVLQIVPLGSAIVSERYTYMPYIGLFYIVAVFFEKWYVQQKKVALIIVLVLAAGMSYASVSRIRVWEDGETLWRDAVAKDPSTSDKAWFGLANILKDKKADPKEVINAYDKAIEINPTYYQFRAYRSIAKNQFGDYTGALKDINDALALSPEYADGYYSRGIVYSNLTRYDSAVADYTKAAAIRPDYKEAIFNRAAAYKKLEKYDEAIADYNRVIILDPSYVDAYRNAGNTYFQLKKFDQAAIFYSKGIAEAPKEANLYMSRGMAEHYQGKEKEACADFNSAAQLGDKDAPQAISSLCR